MKSTGRIGRCAGAAAAALLLVLCCGAGSAAAGWRTVEAESLPAAAGAQAARWAVRLDRGAVESMLVLRRVDAVAVRMRGRRCGRAPRVRVRVDGQVVLSRAATSGSWRRYQARARIKPGRHTVRVEIANPGRRRGCTRGLTVDWIALSERIPIGAAVDWRHFKADDGYRHALIANYDGVTPENDMKFDALRPSATIYSFDRPDAIVELAERESLAVHGHALVFDSQLPDWVSERQKWAPGEVKEMLRSHIRTVVGRYRERVRSWDVVNEPMGKDGKLARTFFVRHLGPEYVDLALQFAREADPTAKLYINETAAEELNPVSDGLFELVRRLLAAGVPLDGVGFQFHSNIGPHAPRTGRARANLERFAALGLEIAVSEMDVRTTTGSGTLEERLIKQADVYSDVAGICAQQPACVRFTTWGVTDRFSWLGAHERGLPFDWAGRAKPAWSAITDVLR
jgi:endo-1,4-beta-xylanase